jgi:uncharacterized protein YwgA
MDRQQIALKLAIDGLGLDFRIGSFQERLILQKVVHLVQAGGVNLGYYYHWYLHGPYCPSLTRDAYAIESELGQGLDESEGWKLDDESQQRLKNLQSLIPQREPAEIGRKLELLASVHFLVNRKQVRERDATEIRMTLERFNKDFTEEEVESGLRELAENDLLTR